MSQTPEWKLVYQGGHHDVWCNGANHQHTEGGWVWNWKFKEIPFEQHRKSGPLSLCSCEYWGNKK